MSPQAQRMLVVMGRRVVMAGLILLGVWLFLFLLRENAPASLLDSIREQRVMRDVDLNDWSRSWMGGGAVGELIGQRLSLGVPTLWLSGLFALGIAGGLLGIGALINSFTERPGWLSTVRRILRQVLVSAFTSSPVLLGIVPLMIFLHLTGIQDMRETRPTANIPLAAFFLALVPAWLLVQNGVMVWRNSGGPTGQRAGQLALASVSRLLRLSGLVISLAVLTDGVYAPGFGSAIHASIVSRDLPLAFGFAWQLTIIVVVAKLAGDLLEILTEHLFRPAEAPVVQSGSPARRTVPTVWMAVCLALVLVTVVAAMFGPSMSRYEYAQISFVDRLEAPSADHVLGTDNLGRDLFTRLLYAVRLDVLVSAGTVAVIFVIAAAWALLAAFLKKRDTVVGDVLHDVVMLPRDILCAVPWLVLLLLLMVFMGPSVLNIAVAAGIVLLPRLMGMIREGALNPPAGNGWLVGLAKALPATAVLAVAGGVVMISAAGYMGLGVPPPVPEIGSMLVGEGRQYLIDAPWAGLWAIMTLIVLLFVWVLGGNALWEWLGFRSGAVWGKALE